MPINEKKTIILGKEKLVIEFTDGGANSKAAARSQEEEQKTQLDGASLGMLPTRSRRPKRRFRQAPGNGFIIPYDLGLILDEDGVYRDRNLLINVTYDESQDFSEEVIADLLTRVKAKMNTPLETPLNEWKTKFKKLSREEAVKYRFAIQTDEEGEPQPLSLDNENYTDRGLKFEKFDWLLQSIYVDLPYSFVDAGGAFSGFLLNDRVKVTAEASYDADAAEFNFLPSGGDVNLFLSPGIQFFNALDIESETESTESIGGAGAGFFTYYWLTCEEAEEFNRKFPAALRTIRNVYTEDSKKLDNFITQWRREQIFSAPPPLYDFQEEILRALKDHPNARVLRREGVYESTGRQWTATQPTDGSEPGILIYATRRCGVPPDPEPSEESEVTDSILPAETFPDDSPLINSRPMVGEGCLLAAINQKNVWRFIWRVQYEN